MRAKIVKLSVTCEINQAASKTCKTSFIFRPGNFKANYKTPPNFMKFSEESRETLEQQSKFKHGKFNKNHLKSFKKCLVNNKISQNFPAFQLGITVTESSMRSQLHKVMTRSTLPGTMEASLSSAY